MLLLLLLLYGWRKQRWDFAPFNCSTSTGAETNFPLPDLQGWWRYAYRGMRVLNTLPHCTKWTVPFTVTRYPKKDSHDSTFIYLSICHQFVSIKNWWFLQMNMRGGGQIRERDSLIFAESFRTVLYSSKSLFTVICIEGSQGLLPIVKW